MTATETIDAIKRLSTQSILRALGYRLSHDERRFGPCPECGADKPSNARRDPHVIRADGTGYRCYGPTGGEGCAHTGSNVDLILHHYRHDPRRLDSVAIQCLRDYLDGIGASTPSVVYTPPPPKPALLSHTQIQAWYANMHQDRYSVCEWLMHSRGIEPIRTLYGAVTSPRQLPTSRPDLRAAAMAGPCAAFPLRSLVSGQIANVTVRPLKPFLPTGETKPWKARCLNAGHDTTRDGGLPLVYGSPDRASSSEQIIICEGAIDQLTIECLSAPGTTVIGAFCADDIPLLAPWLKMQPCPRIVFVPHLDTPTDRYPHGIGVARFVQLRDQIPHARILPWRQLLAVFGLTAQSFRASGRSDINDLVRLDAGPQITTMSQLFPLWQQLMRGL